MEMRIRLLDTECKAILVIKWQRTELSSSVLWKVECVRDEVEDEDTEKNLECVEGSAWFLLSADSKM